jgi:hypothetical protein
MEMEQVLIRLKRAMNRAIGRGAGVAIIPVCHIQALLDERERLIADLVTVRVDLASAIAACRAGDAPLNRDVRATVADEAINAVLAAGYRVTLRAESDWVRVQVNGCGTRASLSNKSGLHAITLVATEALERDRIEREAPALRE